MVRLFIVAIFVLAGCTSTQQANTSKIFNAKIDKLKSIWKIPSQTLCESHGGVFIDKRKVCEATYTDAVKICQSMNAKVPKLDTYIQMAYDCGVTEEGIAHYNYRDTYRLCLKELSIHPVRPSWSSKVAKYDNAKRIYFSPRDLNTHQVSYSSKKDVGHVVACVK
jgi:hypothetical protein